MIDPMPRRAESPRETTAEQEPGLGTAMGGGATDTSMGGGSYRLASDPITFAYRAAYQAVLACTLENERRTRNALDAAERIRAAAEQAATATLKRAEEENAQRLSEARQRAESLVQRAESLVVFARRQLYALGEESQT